MNIEELLALRQHWLSSPQAAHDEASSDARVPSLAAEMSRMIAELEYKSQVYKGKRRREEGPGSF